MTKTKDDFIIHHTSNYNDKLYLARFIDTNIGETTEIQAEYVAASGILRVKSNSGSIIWEFKGTSTSVSSSANTNPFLYLTDTGFGIYYILDNKKEHKDLINEV